MLIRTLRGLLTASLLLIISCRKQCYEAPDISLYRHFSIDTIDIVELYTNNHYGWDTIGAFLTLKFHVRDTSSWLKVDNHGCYYKVGRWNYRPPSHYLKYVGVHPLLISDSAKLYSDLGSYKLIYKVNPILIGKPIFEDRIAENDSLWKTYVFSSKAQVDVSYFYEDTSAVPLWCPPEGIPVKEITESFNFYTTAEYLTNKRYDLTQYFLGFPVGIPQYSGWCETTWY
jgi:hypothetical protein